MSKKESVNFTEDGGKNYGAKRMNTSGISKKNKDRTLPWWVELLFVQLGLPDKYLIKILKTNKKTKEFVKNDKKLILSFLVVITAFAYFYPVIKHAKNKLDCENTAKTYITKRKNIRRINKKELKMLSTNFCYGGEEIYAIENLKN